MKISGSSSRSATLKDIAKMAGVHHRTVQDALQGTGRVAPATRENVLRIARELHYEPNLLARALVTGKTGRISLILGKLNEPYNVTVGHHLVDSITRHGYEAMIIQERENRPSAQAIRSALSDGIVVVGLHFINTSSKANGIMRGHTDPPLFPCVVIDAGRPDFMDHITLDLGYAVEEALHLMIASGRRRIAYINKHPMDPDSQEVRFRAYVDLVTAAGYEPEFIVANDKLSPAQRIEQIKAYIQQNGAPGAIFCHNDELAVFTYRALRDLGYEIPKHSLIVGCDGVDYTNYFDTPLSTITVDWEEVGEMACQFLKRRIDEPDIPVQEHIVQGKLVVRKSLRDKD